MWAERQLGLALGNYLSYEAIKKIVNTLKTVFHKSFNTYNWGDNPVSQETRKVKPPSLAHTPGYVDNSFMRIVMIEKGILRPNSCEAKRRGRRPIISEQRLAGWKYLHIFRNGPLRRFHEREGALTAHIYLLKRADEVPDWSVEEPREDDANHHDEEDPDEWTDDENIQIEIRNDGTVGVVRRDLERMEMQEDIEIEQIEIQEEEIEEKGEKQKEQDGRRVVVETEEKGEKQKEQDGQRVVVEVEEKGERQKNCNQDDNELNEVLRKLQDAERKLKIQEENSKAYQKENENKDAMIAKEKAATKYWKQQLGTIKDKCEHVPAEFGRLEEQYKFVSSLYESSKPRANKRQKYVASHNEDEKESDGEIEEQN